MDEAHYRKGYYLAYKEKMYILAITITPMITLVWVNRRLFDTTIIVQIDIIYTQAFCSQMP